MPLWCQGKVTQAAAIAAGLVFSAAPEFDPNRGTAAAFEFTKVVDTFTPVPGGTSNFAFNFSDIPAVSGNRVLFGTADLHVWVGRLNGTGLRKIITPHTKIPGGFGTFKQFFGTYATIYQDTVVLVGDNCGGCGSGVGLYARSVDKGPITKFADINDFFPGSDTEKFQSFQPDFDVDGDHIAFNNGGRIFKVPLAGGRVRKFAVSDNVLFAQPTFSDQFGTLLVLASNVFYTRRIQTFDRVIADKDTHPPKTPETYRFDPFEFNLPVLDQAADHIFHVFRGASTDGEGGPYIQGVYSRGSAGFKRLVDTTMDVPGGTGKFAINPGFDQIAAANGIVIFRGRDEANKVGLYAVPASGGPITKIIATGDPIDGFTVQELSIRRDSFDGITLAFGVSYGNVFGGGIYTTPIVLP